MYAAMLLDDTTSFKTYLGYQLRVREMVCVELSR